LRGHATPFTEPDYIGREGTLRVEDDDHPEPIATVRERFRRWADTAGGGRALATTRLPGRDGAYVVFAAAAPA
jgi:hypothetical protein